MIDYKLIDLLYDTRKSDDQKQEVKEAISKENLNDIWDLAHSLFEQERITLEELHLIWTTVKELKD